MYCYAAFSVATEEISWPSWNSITRELNLFLRNSSFNKLISVDERQEIALTILNFKGNFWIKRIKTALAPFVNVHSWVFSVVESFLRTDFAPNRILIESRGTKSFCFLNLVLIACKLNHWLVKHQILQTLPSKIKLTLNFWYRNIANSLSARKNIRKGSIYLHMLIKN